MYSAASAHSGCCRWNNIPVGRTSSSRWCNVYCIRYNDCWLLHTGCFAKEAPRHCSILGRSFAWNLEGQAVPRITLVPTWPSDSEFSRTRTRPQSRTRLPVAWLLERVDAWWVEGWRSALVSVFGLQSCGPAAPRHAPPPPSNTRSHPAALRTSLRAARGAKGSYKRMGGAAHCTYSVHFFAGGEVHG